jgi:K+-sensing histidine kinase KdpD
MELEREKKVINMMITMHSILSSKYSRLSSIFEITLLIASVILNTLIFADPKFISKSILINENDQKLILGFASVIVFAISIVLLQVKWKERSEDHCRASEQLFILLQECRTITSIKNEEERNALCQEFYKRYLQVTNMLVKIPDSKFNSLKLAHYRKIELSKLIDKFPRSSLFILKMKLFISSFNEKK